MAINSGNHSVLLEKMQRCQDYIRALEEERRKIEVFRRELPLCLELVTQAIESCKQQLSGTTIEYNLIGQSESSEQTSTEGPVLEEFIPIKRISSHSDLDEQEQESKKAKIDDTNESNKDGKNVVSDKNIKKSDWLRSVQLWNQTSDLPSKEDDSPKRVEMKSSGAFHPFKKEKNGVVIASPASASSTAGADGSGNGGEDKKEGKERQSRKARRCWSPELHKRFLQALHQLGGSHVATPKQIRDLMKVDGLTNDEVKSHLQKFRLHTRRPSPSTQNNTTPTTQAPQFVVVTGGLWMPPEYTTAMATTAMSREALGGVTASNGVYAPIASLPQPLQESPNSSKQRQRKTSNSKDIGTLGERGVRSNSPATSSSTHETTTSLAY